MTFMDAVHPLLHPLSLLSPLLAQGPLVPPDPLMVEEERMIIRVGEVRTAMEEKVSKRLGSLNLTLKIQAQPLLPLAQAQTPKIPPQLPIFPRKTGMTMGQVDPLRSLHPVVPVPAPAPAPAPALALAQAASAQMP